MLGPVAEHELHLDRARAESFGSVAERYDRFRPTYPDALIDDLAALRPAEVLDIGCGTGKVAVALAARGLPVLGVEPDERMAGVARGHGIPVQVAAFETWDDAGRQFDLITCGGAWHWIDPDRGLAKAAKVLRPGGAIARFWENQVLDEPVIAAFYDVYREHAPEIAQGWRQDPVDAPGALAEHDVFAESKAFGPVEQRAYQAERTYSAEEWVGLMATVSDHQRLGPERLAALLDPVQATIENKFAGVVQSHCGTYVLLARRG
jgi:SAM-dependent methyltransferase